MIEILFLGELSLKRYIFLMFGRCVAEMLLEKISNIANNTLFLGIILVIGEVQPASVCCP